MATSKTIRHHPAADEEPGRDFVTAFARGLAVIQAFGPENRAMTLSQIAERTGFDRAVARRLLLTLVGLGFARVHERRFELTTRVLRLAYSFLSSAGLGASLQPFLDDLAVSIGETTSLSVLDDAEVVFVARSDIPGRRLSYVVTTGMRLPAFSSASGRMLLAHKPRIEVERLLARTRITRYTRHTIMQKREILALIADARPKGYHINYGELEDGLVSVSVPVFNRAGLVVAALNASTSSARASREKLAGEFVSKLRAMAAELSLMLP
ncbi:helix-turn-helix domain-containing protein [Bradyrhizobium sp. INPA01-394B]|uniref:Helix-turn-helix domain-containing protein n=1 Tax=Bradyrhizobium campsiandrae TaxID=1729892 RepID=A0ABR7UIB5_9BRAD|nr:IclR family transcriptional regulator C-terminal domain-containing protein [Bradyrhizobium campsiandrae]MBC9879386.1 helix-turn-helix domain-containing protein [Bradyrhizobium campsiandrae]MBC9983341.1 helix-turn-helix domain-containing protein [Bradyrhizobium campsiandrae]